MERRRAQRRVPDRFEPLSQARLRTGRNLDVVDISDWGAQLEGAPRLLPGTHVDLHVVLADGRTLVRCRVLRSFIYRLSANAIRYRAAVAFENRLETAAVGYQVPDAIHVAAERPGIAYPGLRGAITNTQLSSLPHRDLRHRTQAGTAFG